MMKNLIKKAERGQVIIIIAFAMVGLIGIVGLMTDGGILLIEYARLKRGIDAAAIASAQQFRRGFDAADLYKAAEGFLILNQSAADNIVVWRCKQNPSAIDGTDHDPDLCTVPLRKLVRVDAERTVNFGFMRVLGFNSTVIRASAVGEAASLDLVLVFDTSSSMAFETNPAGPRGPNRVDIDADGPPSENPAICNYSMTDPCQPMKDVKDVAMAFINGTIFFPYDRIAVVASTSQTAGGAWNPVPVTTLHFSDDESDVVAAIASLRVLEQAPCDFVNNLPEYGGCLNYDAGGNFIGFDSPHARLTGNPTTFQSSNIGGALYQAGVEFSTEPIREDSFWVVILLAGGPANATNPVAGYPLGICPDYTWVSDEHPPCRDALASTRHSDTDLNYDADDYARDAADFLANPTTGMGVTVFTIGLGSNVIASTLGDPDAGEKLLEYIAETAGNESGVTVNHGAYFYAPDSSGLGTIFSLIAENIFTRLTK